MLEYRQLNQFCSTYGEGLANAADASGRIHTSFKQTVTATGRLSSNEPNLQNIPVRTELGRELRRYFIPEDGYVLLDTDYSQIELRILAAISGDETMMQAFLRGADIHTATAAEVFRVPEEVCDARDALKSESCQFWNRIRHWRILFSARYRNIPQSCRRVYPKLSCHLPKDRCVSEKERLRTHVYAAMLRLYLVGDAIFRSFTSQIKQRALLASASQ